MHVHVQQAKSASACQNELGAVTPYEAGVSSCACCLQGMDSLPAPDRQDVQLRRQDGGYYAAIVFNGKADPSDVEAKVQQRPCTSMKTCLY